MVSGRRIQSTPATGVARKNQRWACRNWLAVPRRIRPALGLRLPTSPPFDRRESAASARDITSARTRSLPRSQSRGVRARDRCSRSHSPRHADGTFVPTAHTRPMSPTATRVVVGAAYKGRGKRRGIKHVATGRPHFPSRLAADESQRGGREFGSLPAARVRLGAPTRKGRGGGRAGSGATGVGLSPRTGPNPQRATRQSYALAATATARGNLRELHRYGVHVGRPVRHREADGSVTLQSIGPSALPAEVSRSPCRADLATKTPRWRPPGSAEGTVRYRGWRPEPAATAGLRKTRVFRESPRRASLDKRPRRGF